MAGGKETPRQKMISLMYLVLLAMLALQVSSVIIEKFQQLNESMESSIDASGKRNSEIYHQIEEAVKKGKFAKADVEVLNAAKEVREESASLMSFIEGLKKSLVVKTGGKDELGSYNGAKEEEPVSNFMLGSGESKSGEAYKLKKRLDAYSSQLMKIAKKHKVEYKEEGLALDGKENDMFKNNPEQRRKDFAHLNFEGAPLVAALAVMSERGNKIMSLEAEMLSKLALKVGALNIPIDKVRPVVKANSNMVVAGTEYNAEFFMAAYSCSFKPEMTFNSNKVDVNGEGVGSISFKASGGNYNAEGLLKKMWTGTIKYPKSGGGDTVYTINQEYTVVKPVIQATSGAGFSLYKDCGNKVTMQVPALGTQYDPSFSASGAKIKMTSEKGKVIIIPSAPTVDVKVKNNGVYIGSVNCKVHLIPLPSIELKCQNRPVDPIRGVPKSMLRDVELKPVPDNGFKQNNPRDARYKTTHWEAVLVRNGRTILGPVIIDQEKGRLTEFAQEARPGDRVVIDKVVVKRKNFEDRILDVEIGHPVFMIPIQ